MKFWVVCIFTLLFSGVCRADMNELIVEKTREAVKEMGFSDDFINSLKDCTPIKETKIYNGVEIVYEIKGRDTDGKCVIVSQGNHEKVQNVSTCKFDDDILDLYYNAQLQVRKLIANANSLEEILSDENYLFSMGLFADDELCENHRSEFDPTKELRKKLAACEPYQETEQTNRYELITNVEGKFGNICRYTMKTITKAPKEEDLRKFLGDEAFEKMKDYLLKDISITTKCAFSSEELQKYIAILEKTAIPSGDAYDFSYLDQIQQSNREAVDFLMNSPDCKSYQ